mmetsp:Transcript_60994/g.149346  ORF Transcript_60994/g.149346 Transcript_60994/m.149346 type:complete len:239 (-) Transcript_60994:503-1219(-)
MNFNCPFVLTFLLPFLVLSTIFFRAAGSAVNTMQTNSNYYMSTYSRVSIMARKESPRCDSRFALLICESSTVDVGDVPRSAESAFFDPIRPVSGRRNGQARESFATSVVMSHELMRPQKSPFLLMTNAWWSWFRSRTFAASSRSIVSTHVSKSFDMTSSTVWPSNVKPFLYASMRSVFVTIPSGATVNGTLGAMTTKHPTLFFNIKSITVRSVSVGSHLITFLAGTINPLTFMFVLSL